MKDTLIINSISKVYFSIVSFFIFIFLTLSVTFLLLNSGVKFENIDIGSVNIDKLYIKWDEKLNIYIKEINISKNNSKSAFKPKTQELLKHINKIVYLPILIESVSAQKIVYGDLSGSLEYKQAYGGNFELNSDRIAFASSISSSNKHLNISIDSFENKDINLSAKANIILDARTNMFFIDSVFDLKDELSLNVSVKSDTKRLEYAISSNKNIPSTSYIVSVLNMHPKVKYWVDDAIEMQYLDIKQAYGYMDYKNPSSALKNFYAYGVANSLEYTYDQKLDPIKTKYTDLVFKDGVLFILPKDPTSYNMNLDASWLRIDFTKPKEILTLHLLFDGILNKDLKNLLERYKIKLPFIQNSGYMDTNLLLAINLITLDVDAKGEFYTDRANFTYLGLDLDLSDTLVKLKNMDIEIPKMSANYKDIASSNIKAKLDLKNSKGYISFDLSKIYFSDDLYLDTKHKSLKAKYIISDNKDTIEIDKSKWSLLGKDATLEKFDFDFDLSSLQAKFPTVELESNGVIHSYISGNADFKNNTYNLDFSVTDFNYNGIELDQSVLDLNLKYKDSLIELSSKEPSSFFLQNQKIELGNTTVTYKYNTFYIDNVKVKFENFFNSTFDFFYDTDSDNGLLSLSNFRFSNDTLSDIFKIEELVTFKIKKFKDQVMVNESNLNISAFNDDKQWVLAFSSLEKLLPYSSFLRRYGIKDGTFSLYKKTGEQDIRFSSKLQHPLNLIYKNNKPVEHYTIKGVSNKENKTSLLINNQINVDIQNSNIQAKGSNVEISLSEVLKFINSINSKNTSKPSNYNISANLTNSKIILDKNRRVLADKINLQYYENETTAQITHKKGEAGFKYKDKNFHIYGSKFGDIFMKNLFSMSDFKGGEFDFSIKGNIDRFSGVALIKDTTIREFRLLNNVLAFVNTIPSLVTFSLPSYNTKGLDAKNTYMMFDYKEKVYNISNFYLESDELNIFGHGDVSLEKNNINMELNLKTDLGSAASKIPIVGHIIFDKDSISTTLKIDGKLDDPNIKSMIAKEIIVAPLNIIKRTLMLPFSVFDN